MIARLIPFGYLLFIGISWGATQPLTKIAVSTGHGHFGLIFWQLVISVIVLGSVNVVRRRPLPMHRAVWKFYIVIALVGTVIPNTTSYQAIAVLPSGLMSLFLSLVPMLAFPVALALGLDRFNWRRLGGLSLGLVAVLLIVGVPEALPQGAMLAFVPLSIVAPVLYAFEGNFVAKWGTGGAGPIQLLLGASVVGSVIAAPLAWYSGHWINPLNPWGQAEWALLGASVIHSIVYTMYVTIIGRFGPVFSVQVGYVVTLSGLGWAMLILGEAYTGPIWVALALLMCGVYLVSPKPEKDT
ncbi:MAG: DMT family transporter [Planktomarina sp.]